MTVQEYEDLICIRHVNVGFDPEVTSNDFTDMGMELAIWLEAMIVGAKLGTGVPDLASLGNPDLALRAQVAAERSYRPALVTRAGILTGQGEILGLAANQILQKIRAYDYELTDPKKWTKVNEMIIRADFPKRAAKLLYVIDRAVQSAIKNHETGADEIISRFQAAQPEPPVPEKEDDVAMTIKEMRSRGHEISDFVGEIHRDVCYVPTARFSARAKYDMEILIKFSLLDVRFLRPVGRGRPRMAIKISDLGTRFLKDLVERQLV
jgi:hypothetical protein